MESEAESLTSTDEPSRGSNAAPLLGKRQPFFRIGLATRSAAGWVTGGAVLTMLIFLGTTIAYHDSESEFESNRLRSILDGLALGALALLAMSVSLSFVSAVLLHWRRVYKLRFKVVAGNLSVLMMLSMATPAWPDERTYHRWRMLEEQRCEAAAKQWDAAQEENELPADQ